MTSTQTIQFSEIVIIESLPAAETQTGSVLYSDLTSRPDLPVTVSLFNPHTAEDFLATLDSLALKAQGGGWVPLIHFEVHGTDAQDGVVTASEEHIVWDDIAASLRHLNIAVRNSVIVVLGVCSGAYILTAAANSPFEPAPFSWLVGPDRTVFSFYLPRGFQEFYAELLNSGDFGKAVARLRQSALPEYVALDAAKLFRKGWEVYESTQTTGPARAKRVKSIFRRARAGVVAEFGSNNKARRAIAREIKNTSSRRREYYRHFIMADLFPENIDRFPDIDQDYPPSITNSRRG